MVHRREGSRPYRIRRTNAANFGRVARAWQRRDADSHPPPAPGGVTVSDISPNTMLAGAMINVTITGSGFQPGALVAFENGSGPAPVADVTDVWPDGFTIEATMWDVRVTNPDASTGALTAGFVVIR